MSRSEACSYEGSGRKGMLAWKWAASGLPRRCGSRGPPLLLLPHTFRCCAPIPTRNLPQTLAAAQLSGWLVLGAAAEPGAAPASRYVLDRPAVLVMGNEGYGLRTTVRRLCDAMLQARGGL